MHLTLILELLILLAVANGTPVFAKKLLGDRFAQPLDGGSLFADGRPLFGPSKTVRGLLLSILATAAAAALLGLGWQVGAIVGAVAMAGDLASSFVKRRLALPPSSRATGLDQIPESLFPLLAASALLPLGALDIVVATLAFFLGEIVLSRLLYKWRIRDRPY
jgi:CDP-2,3-bis-(O-geranylgeranyl)-sn-glycerol synthase